MSSVDQPCVCEFAGVAVAGSSDQLLDLRVGRGELWVVEVPRSQPRPDVAGAALGMNVPEAGYVELFGVRWGSESLAEAEALRQRTGRVFDIRQGPVWLQNLDIEENVLLPHTMGGIEKIEKTMTRMRVIGERVGFAEIPKSRPSVTELEVTQRAQWVRALMRLGLELLVLEVPTRGVGVNQIEALVAEIKRVLAEGVAVLWITDGSEREGAVPEDLVTGRVFYGKSQWTEEANLDEDR